LGKSFLEAGDKGDMRVIILDDGISSELCQVFQEELSTVIAGKTEMTSYYKSDPVHMQAFAVRLTADELDIVIAPEEEMRQMAGNGYLVPYDANEVTSFYAGFPEENFLKVSMDGSEVIVAVKLMENSRYMTYRREAGATEGALYLGVTIKKRNDKNMERSALYFSEENVL